jgi:hypothetical protein
MLPSRTSRSRTSRTAPRAFAIPRSHAHRCATSRRGMSRSTAARRRVALDRRRVSGRAAGVTLTARSCSSRCPPRARPGRRCGSGGRGFVARSGSRPAPAPVSPLRCPHARTRLSGVRKADLHHRKARRTLRRRAPLPALRGRPSRRAAGARAARCDPPPERTARSGPAHGRAPHRGPAEGTASPARWWRRQEAQRPGLDGLSVRGVAPGQYRASS